MIKHNTFILEGLTSKGKLKFWQGFVAERENGVVVTYTVSWQQKDDGTESKKVQSADVVIVPKNVGRSNETTPLEQAISEMNSAAQVKMDKGYVVHGLSLSQIPAKPVLPMLAHDYAKRGKNITFPCYVQPKLDGVRAVNTGIELTSRTGKAFPPQLTQQLNHDYGFTLDGELMLPQKYTFEDIVSAAKATNELTPHLIYHVYDIIDLNKTFDERLKIINNLDDLPAQFHIVPTFLVNNEEELEAQHKRFVGMGYEGTMLRNKDSKYKTNYRSTDLQKRKDFVDNEFIITNLIEGVGKEKGAAIFICQTPAGKTFKVRPEGSYDQRALIWNNPQDYIGQQLTVRYQNLTADGIPRFPVGLRLRDTNL